MTFEFEENPRQDNQKFMKNVRNTVLLWPTHWLLYMISKLGGPNKNARLDAFGWKQEYQWPNTNVFVVFLKKKILFLSISVYHMIKFCLEPKDKILFFSLWSCIFNK